MGGGETYLWDQPSGRGAVAWRCIGWGLWTGAVGGGVAGTLVVPIAGTLFGALFGVLLAVLPTAVVATVLVVACEPGLAIDRWELRVRLTMVGVLVVMLVAGFGWGTRTEVPPFLLFIAALAGGRVLVHAADGLEQIQPDPVPSTTGGPERPRDLRRSIRRSIRQWWLG